MSSIKPSHVLLTALLALVLGGCGDRNDKAVFSTEGGHPSDWMSTHKTSARVDVASCAECHGENYSGGVSKVSCMSPTAISGLICHATSPAANLTGCVSCHGIGPFGTTAPNRVGAHAKHTVLPGIGCGTCHLNAGSGTPGHAKANTAGGISRATVASPASFPFVYNANGTCSNVSCHGGTGTVTLPWSTGLISIVAGNDDLCRTCHAQGTAAGNPQYNSFYSGIFSLYNTDTGVYTNTNLHTFHMTQTYQNEDVHCTDCHNIGTLTDYQKHFGGVATKTLTSPGMTIGGSPTKIGFYTASTKSCNTVQCHPNNFGGNWVPAQAP